MEYWSNGVLEYRNTGMLARAYHYSITPTLQYSILVSFPIQTHHQSVKSQSLRYRPPAQQKVPAVHPTQRLAAPSRCPRIATRWSRSRDSCACPAPEPWLLRDTTAC